VTALRVETAVTVTVYVEGEPLVLSAVDASWLRDALTAQLKHVGVE
jgi:hypothetical protein